MENQNKDYHLIQIEYLERDIHIGIPQEVPRRDPEDTG